MDTFTFIIAIMALILSGYQQIIISKICKDCPWNPQNKNRNQPVLRNPVIPADYPAKPAEAS